MFARCLWHTKAVAAATALQIGLEQRHLSWCRRSGPPSGHIEQSRRFELSGDGEVDAGAGAAEELGAHLADDRFVIVLLREVDHAERFELGAEEALDRKSVV